jgi:DNA transformation protein
MADEGFVAHVLDQLSEFGTVTAKSMFGGHGLYHEGVFFGLITGQGVFHLYTSEESRQAYIDAGMPSFNPRGKGDGPSAYFVVPDEVLEDREELASWARTAYEAKV